MRVLASSDVKAAERVPSLGIAGVFAMVAALIALRVYCAFTLGMNSDEPQHLHVVWAWTQGFVPYRDVFDNHAPLFQWLCAPLLAWLGERSDIVALMRLAMLPLYLGALSLTWYIGKVLWSPRVGRAAAVLAASAPIFFIVSIQFRPDDLWALLWLAIIAASVAPEIARHRAAIVGLLVGTALAVSLKTLLLLFAGGVAWLTVPGVLQEFRRSLRQRSDWAFAQGLLCALIVPGLFAAYFVSIGSWREAVYCIFTHNFQPHLGHWGESSLRLLFPLFGYPLAVALTWWKGPRDTDDARWRQRAWLLLSSILYLLLLYGCWPLVTHQDLLPVIPLVAIGVAAVIFPVDGSGTLIARIVLAAAVTAINVVNLATAGLPPRNELAPEQDELARVLALTRPGDDVMDAKGEAIFRRRPVYWALEDITEARMREGSIADDITERLIATGTPLVIMDRLPARDAAFVQNNYLVISSASGLIYIAGQRLGVARAGVGLSFDVRVPTDYAIVSPGGLADGVLDGLALHGARRLVPGRHLFVPSADSGLAVVWAPALQRGLQISELFTATDR